VAQSRRNRALNNLPRWSDGPVVYWIRRDMRVWDNWTSLEAADQASFPLTETLQCELVAEIASGATMHVEVMPCNWSW
jgi:hypothetical protein